MKYEYKQIYVGNNSTISFIDEVNEWAKHGFRLVSSGMNESGGEWAILEKTIN